MDRKLCRSAEVAFSPHCGGRYAVVENGPLTCSTGINGTPAAHMMMANSLTAAAIYLSVYGSTNMYWKGSGIFVGTFSRNHLCLRHLGEAHGNSVLLFTCWLHKTLYLFHFFRAAPRDLF